MGKRRFGRVRKLPSGRWQACYPGPDAKDHTASYTFTTKRDAEQWLTVREADIKRGDWLDPAAGAVPFAEYATEWTEDRELSPKTAQLGELLLRRHLNPAFGQMAIGDIREETVRKWRAARLKAGPSSEPLFGPVTVAKAYRLLRAILNTRGQEIGATLDKMARRELSRARKRRREHQAADEASGTQRAGRPLEGQGNKMSDTCPELGSYRRERVTGIEPALSAWDLCRPGCHMA